MARTLVASDDFNRANGAIGSNWTYIRDSAWQGAAPTISSNAVVPGASGDHYQLVRWAGSGTFANDQYAKAAVGSLTWQDGTYRVGVAVRISADLNTAADYYAFWVQDDGPSNRTSKLVKVVDGTETVLDSRSTAWASGDTISLEASGTTISAYKNDVLMFSVTDSALSTGKPGFMIAGGGGVPKLDNWEGGDIGSSSVTGTASWTEANDSAALGGTVTVTGSASWSESDDTLTAGAAVQVSVAAGWSEANDGFDIAGSIAGVVTASAAWTEANDTASIAGTVTVNPAGTLSWGEENDAITITGAVTMLPAGAIAWTEANDACSMVGESAAITFARAPAGGGYSRAFSNTTRPASGNKARPRNEQ